jgi:hypothetical protein
MYCCIYTTRTWGILLLRDFTMNQILFSLLFFENSYVRTSALGPPQRESLTIQYSWQGPLATYTATALTIHLLTIHNRSRQTRANLQSHQDSELVPARQYRHSTGRLT